MINTINVSPGISNTLPVKTAESPQPGSEISKNYSRHNDTSTVSNIALQLGESAVRAEARDRTLSRAELGAQAERIRDELTGYEYRSAKVLHNAQVPNTSDPGLLQRAIDATDYMTHKAAGDPGVKSPFAGLSQAELILIAYDDKGPYTVNERRAAWDDAQAMELSWRDRAVAQCTLEYSSAKKMPGFYTQALAHYQTLPSIEKTQYPENYESRLKAQIQAQLSRKTDDRQYSLFEILAGMGRASESAKPEPRKGEPLVPATTAKAKNHQPMNPMVSPVPERDTTPTTNN